MFADLSAGSGLNFFTRDEEHSKGFLERQQDKPTYGSDCSDRIGTGPDCQGTQTIAAIRQLSPDKLPSGNYCMTCKKNFSLISRWA